jgi:Zn-dependent peptidase ImmA (M78 family)
VVVEAPAQLPISPLLLRQARERANLDLADAAQRVGRLLKRERDEPVREQELRLWEQGDRQPSLAEAEALARAYLIPFVVLFDRELPPANVTDFRRGPGGRETPLSYGTLAKLNRFAARLYLLAKRISSELGITETVSVPAAQLRDLRSAEDIETLATSVRRQLGISDEMQISWRGDAEAFNAWRSGIEGNGVFVFSLSMSVLECRGASIWEAGGPPAVLVNSSDSPTAQAFTLMHEFAHLMFSGREQNLTLCDPSGWAQAREERIANRLASSVLMPRSLVEGLVVRPVPASFSQWPVNLKQHLRRSLNVSQAAIAIRLAELGLITDAGKQTFWRGAVAPRGKSRPVWQRYRRYLGERTVGLARQALEADLMSATDLCRILDVKVRDIEAMLAH